MKQITEGFLPKAGGATEGVGEPPKTEGGDVPLNQFCNTFPDAVVHNHISYAAR